jgi:hypothetical protein
VDSNRSKCWAIKGSKPIKFTSGSKAKINIGGFYTENGEFYWYDLGIKKNTDSYLKSLIDLKRDIGVKIFLILDRATWHRSAKAKEFYQNNNSGCKYYFFLQLLQIGIQQNIVGKKKRRVNINKIIQKY